MDIFDFLESEGLAFQRFNHDPVYTCEQADAALQGAPGARTKNLFLRDDKGSRHLLLMTRNGKHVDLRGLGEMLHIKKLGFASAEKLQRLLGIEPGAVTVLALLNDTLKQVELFVDRELWEEDFIQCHPLVNTATLVLARADLEKFFAVTGHMMSLIDVPPAERNSQAAVG